MCHGFQEISWHTTFSIIMLEKKEKKLSRRYKKEIVTCQPYFIDF